ncbi:MAG: leucine-rich repeat domain-containing protein [Firmicutes bacterium]|nr:leucine-rich repeat domain-containing protein [Bacillota bacterium]
MSQKTLRVVLVSAIICTIVVTGTVMGLFATGIIGNSGSSSGPNLMLNPQAQFRYTAELDNTVRIHSISRDWYRWEYAGKYDLVIPDTINGLPVTQIDANAFNENNQGHLIRSLRIPDTVHTIGASAFNGAVNLHTVNIPKSLTVIQNSTFRNTGIREVIIPNGVHTIGAAAFRDSTQIEKLVVSESVTLIGNSAFRGLTNLRHLEFNNTSKIFNGERDLEGNPLPVDVFHATAGGNTVGNVILASISNLEFFKVPYGFTEIGDAQFRDDRGFNSLETIVLPETIERIGESAFQRMTTLRNINIHENITEIGNYAFWGSGLEKLVIPETVLYIGTTEGPYHVGEGLTTTRAFENMANLHTIKILGGLRDAADTIFHGTNNLHTIVFGESLERIGPQVIRRGSTFPVLPIRHLEIHGNPVTASVEIGANFAIGVATEDGQNPGIDTLETLVLGEGVSRVGAHAFRGTHISRLDLPSSLVTIEDSAFSMIESLDTLTLAPNSSLVTIGPFAFAGLNNQARIPFATLDGVLPTSLRIIDTGAFQFTNLSAVTLPEGLVTIGANAFLNVNFTGVTLTIPSTVRDTATPVTGYFYVPNPIPGQNGTWEYMTRDEITIGIGAEAFRYSGISRLIFAARTMTLTLGDWAFADIGTLVNIEIAGDVNVFEFPASSDLNPFVRSGQVGPSGTVNRQWTGARGNGRFFTINDFI